MEPVSIATIVVLTIGGGIGVYSAALALGIRHGIDWDHIAAITDITSTAASSSVSEEREGWLLGEPGVSLTDEGHHLVHGEHTHDPHGQAGFSGPRAEGASTSATAVATRALPIS